MKKIFQKFILVGFTAMMLFGFATNVHADNLDVVFTPNPLFNQSNFLPMDVTSGTVTVTNNSNTTQNILTEAINVVDTDNFGNLLHLTIKENSTTLFDNTLSNFLSTAGEVSLGTLPVGNGDSKTFTYTISFNDSSDNSYQGKTLGFDICVGFEGGQSRCGDTVIGGENGEGGGGSSSGSGSSGSVPLIITNEQALNISNVGESATATITWNTNKLSTSQVVYGPVPPATAPDPYVFPYTLAIVAPNFGYPFWSTEDSTKVVNHSVFLTGLIPGQTYVYRVISHASPPTISFEHQFTVPLTGPLAQAPNNNFTGGNPVSGNNGTENGEVLGASAEETANLKDASRKTDSAGNILTGNILLSGFNNLFSICTLIGILILLVFYIVWKLWLRKKFEDRGLEENQIEEKFFKLFAGFTLLCLIISILIREYCILPIFLIVFIISLVVYFVRRKGR